MGCMTQEKNVLIILHKRMLIKYNGQELAIFNIRQQNLFFLCLFHFHLTKCFYLKEMATHSNILAWRIPWMEELGGLQSMGHKESDTTERLYFHFHFYMRAEEQASFSLFLCEIRKKILEMRELQNNQLCSPDIPD